MQVGNSLQHIELGSGTSCVDEERNVGWLELVVVVIRGVFRMESEVWRSRR